MKTQINATVSGVIELAEDERFQVTAGGRYGGPNYTVLVERARPWRDSHWDGTKTRRIVGVELSGRRVLKDGSVSYQNKTVALEDGDERIPATIAEEMVALRRRLDHVRAYIAEEA